MLRTVVRARPGRLNGTLAAKEQTRRFFSFSRGRRLSNTGFTGAIAAGIAAAGAFALYHLPEDSRWKLNAKYVFASDSQPGTEQDPQDAARPSIIHAKESGSFEISSDSPSARIGSKVSDAAVYLTLYRFAQSFLPPEEDKSGIARADTASMCNSSSGPRMQRLASIASLPTHSWGTFGLLDGLAGPTMSSALFDIFGLAILSVMADLLDAYDTTRTSTRAYGEETEMSPFFSINDSSVTPFTPDIVRPIPPPYEIDKALKFAFVAIDNHLMYDALEGLAKHLAGKESINGDQLAKESEKVNAALHANNGNSGSSALIGFYESDTQVLRVALTGDSRAVLGRPVKPLSSRSDHGTLYQPYTLTADQTPSNAEEAARLRALHPSKRLFFDDATANPSIEPKRKTYLGIPVTRAFGFGCLKWSLDFQRRLYEEFLGDEPPQFFLDGTLPTPPGFGPDENVFRHENAPTSNTVSSSASPSPSSARNLYLTAEPEVTSVHIKPGDFVVLGSRGLFSCLNDEEVVGLVGLWIEERRRKPGPRQHPTNPIREKEFASSVSSLRDPRTQEVVNAKELKNREDMERLQQALSDSSGQKDMGTLMSLVDKLPGMDMFGTKSRKVVDRKELPIASPAVGSGGIPPSTDEADIALEMLSEKNSKLNAPRKAFRYTLTWKTPHPMFVYDERDRDNAAVHVLRNAFGGADDGLAGALRNIQGERADKLMEEAGLQVIFFE